MTLCILQVRLCPKHLRQLNHKSLERATKKKKKKKKSDGSKHDEHDDVSLEPGRKQEQSPSVSPRSSKKRKRGSDTITFSCTSLGSLLRVREMLRCSIEFTLRRGQTLYRYHLLLRGGFRGPGTFKSIMYERSTVSSGSLTGPPSDLPELCFVK